MAERTVAVNLVARVEPYMAAMAKASGATAGFSSASQASLTQLGSSMQTVGRRMTTFLTVPIVGVGAVATKMAMDFDTAFGQIAALTNVSAGEIDSLRDSVLELAGSTAQAPQELAEALYFAASAGLESADAMEVVEMAAQASASGMGETEDVVRVLAAVLNVYGASNISAAQAADILTAAVQEGAAAPEEYAESLGRVIPVAAQMGISFDEVAGSIAFLTNQGLDADEAVTALRGTMLALLDPSVQGRQTLQDMGTSVDELHAAIAEDGLMGALVLLRDHGFAGNSEALSNLVEDNRALIGAMNLVSDESGTLDGILAATADSAGALGDAFGTTAETDAFKMRQALVDIQTAMVQLGGVLLPIVADIASAISGLVTWFTDLPGPVKAVVGGFLGLVAAAGPLVFIAGSLVRNLSTLISGLGSTGGALGTAAKSLGLLGVAIAGGIAVYQVFTAEQRQTEANTKASTAALDTQVVSMLTTAVAAGRAAEQLDSVAMANSALSLALAEGNTQLADSAAALNISGDQVLTLLSTFTEEGEAGVTTLDNMARSFGLTADQAEFFANNYSGLTSPLESVRDAFRAQGAEMGITGEQFDLLTEATASFIDAADESAVEDIAASFLQARVSAFGYKESLVELAVANLGLANAAEDPVAVYREWVRLMAEATPEAQALAGVSQEVTDALAGLSPEAAAAALGIEEVGEAADTAKHSVDLFGTSADSFGKTMANLKTIDKTPVDLFGASLELLDKQLANTKSVVVNATDVWDGWGDAVEGVAGSTIDTMTAVSDIFNETQEAVNNFQNAINNLLAPADSLRETTRAVFEEFENMNTALEENGTSLRVDTEEGRANQEQIEKTRDAIISHGVAMIENGGSAREAGDDILWNIGQLNEQWRAAGMTEDQIAALNTEYGLTPAFINTVIAQAGMDKARADTEALIATYDDIPPELATQISALMDLGQYAEVDRLLAELSRTRGAEIEVYLKGAYEVGATLSSLSATRGAKIVANVIQQSAQGRYVSGPMLSTLGESGPEVVLPLNKPGRMADLLAMPQVFGPIVDAMGKLSAGDTTGGGGGGGAGGGGSTVNVVVNMPPGSNGDDVVRALRQWERRSGPLPIGVR